MREAHRRRRGRGQRSSPDHVKQKVLSNLDVAQLPPAPPMHKISMTTRSFPQREGAKPRTMDGDQSLDGLFDLGNKVGNRTSLRAPFSARFGVLALAAIVAVLFGAGRLSATIGSFQQARAALGGINGGDLKYTGAQISPAYARMWREQAITKEERAIRELAARPITLREPQTIQLRAP